MIEVHTEEGAIRRSRVKQARPSDEIDGEGPNHSHKFEGAAEHLQKGRHA